MADTIIHTDNRAKAWSAEYLREYVRDSGYGPYIYNIKDRPDGIFVVKRDLGKKRGDTVSIPLITRLKGQGVTGGSKLIGNEESIGNYGCPITINWRRNAVVIDKDQDFRTPVDVRAAARPLLKDWSMEKLRDDISTAFLSVISGTNVTVNLTGSTSADRDAYVVGNADRILFGNSVANMATALAATTSEFASGLATLDTTNDKCTAASMPLAKRLAKAADPHIRPFRSDFSEGREYYVAFHGSRTFRDLKLDSAIANANLGARPREGKGMDDNPLFQDGDLIFDGIIHREVPEIDALASLTGASWTSLDGKGASSADVRPVFLCGQQALGIAYGEMPKVVVETDAGGDYEFSYGVGIQELIGVKKMAFNGKQHGMVTAFFAAAADS